MMLEHNLKLFSQAALLAKAHKRACTSLHGSLRPICYLSNATVLGICGLE